jgi:uncharacterized membrane protein HdeD (DUF308 family)
VLAIAYPVFVTLAVDLYLGWLFLFSGLFALAATFLVRQFPGFWWALVNGAAVRPGWRHADLEARGRRGFCDGSPDRFLLAEGLFQAAAALSYREVIPHSWGWLLPSGIADLALAAIIISGWPGTVGWTLGLLAGVSLLTSGWAIVMVTLSLRSLAESVKGAISGP